MRKKKDVAIFSFAVLIALVLLSFAFAADVAVQQNLSCMNSDLCVIERYCTGYRAINCGTCSIRCVNTSGVGVGEAYCQIGPYVW